MSKKTVIVTLLAALALMLVFGCSKRPERDSLYALEAKSSAGTSYARAPAPASDMAWDEQAAADAAATPAEVGDAERKLVKSAYLRIRVENLDAADAAVTGLLQKYDAYAASTVVDENSRTYSLRVPAPRYDIFLAEMNGMGRLLSRYENTEEVTLRYYDLEGRLETKKELLKTFQSYLGTAKTIEEILAVEARISELQYDIEGTGNQLRNLANRVDYATIDLNLMGPAAAHQNRGETFGERLRQMFGGFGGFLAGVVVAIVGIVIYGVPILLLVVLFFWLLFGRIGLLKKLWRLVKGKQ
jgi:TfoX/Sxy family transcriptional regulator of competence genes